MSFGPHCDSLLHQTGVVCGGKESALSYQHDNDTRFLSCPYAFWAYQMSNLEIINFYDYIFH